MCWIASQSLPTPRLKRAEHDSWGYCRQEDAIAEIISWFLAVELQEDMIMEGLAGTDKRILGRRPKEDSAAADYLEMAAWEGGCIVWSIILLRIWNKLSGFVAHVSSVLLILRLAACLKNTLCAFVLFVSTAFLMSSCFAFNLLERKQLICFQLQI